MSVKVIVADIDGCAIDSEHRIGHLLAGDYGTYIREHVHDTPILPVCHLYRKFHWMPGHLLLFITGRKESQRNFTMDQLREHIDPSITPSQVMMRPDEISGDDMHDTELKPYLLGLAGYTERDVFMAFDDRNSVVNMWRSRGILTVQPNYGDF